MYTYTQVLAGDQDTRVMQREGRARFYFDFKTVSCLLAELVHD